MDKNIMQLLDIIFFTPLKVGVVDLPFTLFSLILELILPLFILGLLYRLLLGGCSRLVNKTKLQDEIKEKVKRWFRLCMRVLYFFAILVLIGRLFGAKILEYLGIAYSVLNQPLIESGSTKVTFLTILFTIPVFYLASWAGKASRRIINRSLLSRMGLDEAQQFSVSSLLRYTVMVLVLIIGLSIIGLNLSALTVVFGVLGIGLGFGLQNVISNFFAGLIIIITRPVKEGDRILVNGLEGDIIQIRMISTVINTIRNESIIIPNSHLVGDVVHNLSYYDPSIIITNEIGVSYSSDVDQVLSVLVGVAERNPYRVPSKQPSVRLDAFGDSSINFVVFTWVRGNIDKFEARHWNNVEIWRALKENGIEIPFPQRDVHMRS
ncbi:MAG: mechanosensitive ion channel family protein [Spirochaetaceae bacterium]